MNSKHPNVISIVVSSRTPSQWYNESEGIGSFPEAVRELVRPDLGLEQAENSNWLQDYPNEYEPDEYFSFECFAGETCLEISNVLITHINAYLSDNWKKSLVHSNVKRGICVIFSMQVDATWWNASNYMSLCILKYSHTLIGLWDMRRQYKSGTWSWSRHWDKTTSYYTVGEDSVGKSIEGILDSNYLSTHNRNADQIQLQEPGESVQNSVVSSNTNEYILESTPNT